MYNQEPLKWHWQILRPLLYSPTARRFLAPSAAEENAASQCRLDPQRNPCLSQSLNPATCTPQVLGSGRVPGERGIKLNVILHLRPSLCDKRRRYARLRNEPQAKSPCKRLVATATTTAGSGAATTSSNSRQI